MKLAYQLNSIKHAETLFSTITAAVRPALAAGQRLIVKVEPEKRSLDQNAKFHAICEDFAGTVWAGKQRTSSEWKVLLVSGHAVATKQGAEVVPGLEGEFVNIRESTANMDRARGSSLIEYAIAFAANQGIHLAIKE